MLLYPTEPAATMSPNKTKLCDPMTLRTNLVYTIYFKMHNRWNKMTPTWSVVTIFLYILALQPHLESPYIYKFMLFLPLLYDSNRAGKINRGNNNTITWPHEFCLCMYAPSWVTFSHKLKLKNEQIIQRIWSCHIELKANEVFPYYNTLTREVLNLPQNTIIDSPW